MDAPLKSAQAGMQVKISLNCAYPEDLRPGNFLVARQSNDILLATNIVKAEVELQTSCLPKDTLFSPGFRFILERGFTSVLATLQELRIAQPSQDGSKSVRLINTGKYDTAALQFYCTL